MDKIEIIDIDDGDESEDDDDDEEYGDEEEDEEEYEDSIKKKTDRELLESIALKVVSLERDMKQMQDDLVDVYNLLLEEQGIDDED